MKKDNKYMQRAIELAKQGQNTTAINPNVGCVIVKDNQVIGEGFHKQPGQAHAEINALSDVASNGYSALGATVYVTLEPCTHYGRTPPCVDALIKAGVAKVIIGLNDPNAKVCNKGIEKLQNAGIIVVKNMLQQQCKELNLGFLKRMTTGMPWVTVKLGMTLDAKVATAKGESKWITSKMSRIDVQHLRAKSCAIITSSSSVIADNPKLNVRLSGTVRQPKRVIVDSHLHTSPKAKVFTLYGDVFIYTTCQLNNNTFYNHHLSLEERNNWSALIKNEKLTIIKSPIKNNHVDLNFVIKDLGTNQHCNNVLIEAGGYFVGSLLADNLVDELIIYTAPIFLGQGAKPAFNFPAIESINKAKRFSIHDYCIIGDNLKITLRR